MPTLDIELEEGENHIVYEMPEDEAGFIALHFVNAEYGTDIRDAVRFPNQVKEILGIVADELGIEMDDNNNRP